MANSADPDQMAQNGESNQYVVYMASKFTIYSINQISDLIYQISYIIYKISDIIYKISDISNILYK